MKRDNIIQRILDRYLGLKKLRASSQMENFWEDISNDYQENSEDIELSRKLNQTFTTIRQSESEKRQDNHLQELINKLDYSGAANIFVGKSRDLPRVLIKVAAVLIPFAIIISMLIFYNQRNNKTSNSQVVSTQKGSKTKVVLEDGTIIWLNSESEIKYPSSFKNKDKRTVNLSGEAYFDVVRNEKKPFEVYVSGYKIKVLGTSFNVKAYPTQGKIETTLEKGKIDIEKLVSDNSKAKQQKITLVPNQTIVLYNGKETGIPENSNGENKKSIEGTKSMKEKPGGEIIESDDLSQYTSWKENKLIFKSKSLGELIPDLERWFNIEITVEEDSLNQIICTGKFHNETAEQAIRALSIASKINYEIDKNRVVLKTTK